MRKAALSPSHLNNVRARHTFIPDRMKEREPRPAVSGQPRTVPDAGLCSERRSLLWALTGSPDTSPRA